MKRSKFIFLAMVILLFGFIDPFADRVSAGNDAYKNKKYDDAMKRYEEADVYLPKKADEADLAYNKGCAAYRRKDLDGALEFFRKAVESDKTEIQKKALLNMGNTLADKKDKKSAAEAYISALRIDPEYTKARNNLELLYKKDDQSKKDQNKDSQEGKDKQSGADKNKDNNSSEQSGKDKTDGSIDSDQLQRLLELMKEKPVRRERGKPKGLFDETRDKTW